MAFPSIALPPQTHPASPGGPYLTLSLYTCPEPWCNTFLIYPGGRDDTTRQYAFGSIYLYLMGSSHPRFPDVLSLGTPYERDGIREFIYNNLTCSSICPFLTLLPIPFHSNPCLSSTLNKSVIDKQGPGPRVKQSKDSSHPTHPVSHPDLLRPVHCVHEHLVIDTVTPINSIRQSIYTQLSRLHAQTPPSCRIRTSVPRPSSMPPMR